MTDSLPSPARREGVVLGTSRMDSRGRITIPKRVRERLDLNAGVLVHFEIDGGYAVLRFNRPPKSQPNVQDAVA